MTADFPFSIDHEIAVISSDDSSIQVSPLTVELFTANPAFPYLISFPRTGSHWLRMVMELYFETPSLVRIFYFKNATRFTCYHRHDDDLSIVRENVLYLYRHPVDTVYSQMNYYREDLFDVGRIEYWTTLYCRHLRKWLIDETFTTKKTILTYEGMKNDFAGEFAKVCVHFGVPLNRGKLEAAGQTVTKEEVKKRTLHDRQVVNLTQKYALDKENVHGQFASPIMDFIHALDPRLTELYFGRK